MLCCLYNQPQIKRISISVLRVLKGSKDFIMDRNLRLHFLIVELKTQPDSLIRRDATLNSKDR